MNYSELYLVRQIPENTDRVVSGLILTDVLLRNLKFEIGLYLCDRYLSIHKVIAGLVRSTRIFWSWAFITHLSKNYNVKIIISEVYAFS